MIARVVSGGQTGVDRAALDAAAHAGLERGGWCPRDRRAEDGAIPPQYPLRETPEAGYPTRTRLNVRDSDATLVLTFGPARGGTALTIDYAVALGRPHLVVDLDAEPDPGTAREWLVATAPRTLNVAGPRASGGQGIYERARRFLDALLLTAERT